MHVEEDAGRTAREIVENDCDLELTIMISKAAFDDPDYEKILEAELKQVLIYAQVIVEKIRELKSADSGDPEDKG